MLTGLRATSTAAAQQKQPSSSLRPPTPTVAAASAFRPIGAGSSSGRTTPTRFITAGGGFAGGGAGGRRRGSAATAIPAALAGPDRNGFPAGSAEAAQAAATASAARAEAAAATANAVGPGGDTLQLQKSALKQPAPLTALQERIGPLKTQMDLIRAAALKKEEEVRERMTETVPGGRSLLGLGFRQPDVRRAPTPDRVRAALQSDPEWTANLERYETMRTEMRGLLDQAEIHRLEGEKNKRQRTMADLQGQLAVVKDEVKIAKLKKELASAGRGSAGDVTPHVLPPAVSASVAAAQAGLAAGERSSRSERRTMDIDRRAEGRNNWYESEEDSNSEEDPRNVFVV